MNPDKFMLALALLFILDVWTTLRGLGAGLREGNPVMAYLMRILSPAGALMAVKFALLVWISRHLTQIDARAQWAILAGYVGVVAWNLYQLNKRRA